MAPTRRKTGTKPSGGAVATSGFLYQVVASLHWAVSVHFEALDPGAPEPVLVVEPVGGGDLQVNVPHRRVAVQVKHRQRSRPWSLSSLVNEVLPDLYLAVPERVDTDNTEYVFRTDGRCGPSIAGADLAGASVVEKTIASVRRRRPASGEAKELTRRKVRRLLAGLRLEWEKSASQYEQEIDKVLLGFVSRREECEAKRRELLAVLMKWSAQGPRSFSPSELLQAVSLDAKPFQLVGQLRGRLYSAMRDRLARPQIAFDSALDVRADAGVPPDAWVTVVAGESGVGKSWHLARLACAEPGLVAWVPAAGDSRATLTAASHVVWNEGLGHDNELALDSVARRYRDVHPEGPQPWLTVFVDGVHTAEQALGLADADWKRWGVRLIMTSLPDVAHAVKAQQQDRAVVVEVQRFTPRQAREYFQCRKRQWFDLPRELQQSVELPLLARYFCDLMAEPGWRPTTEYEVVAKYWSRLRTEGTQCDHRSDEAALVALAGSFLQEGAEYPWSAAALSSHHIDDDRSRRLERVGWLARTPGGGAEIPHDRLLSWAVAQALVGEWLQRRRSEAEVGALIERLANGSMLPGGRRLGFLLLDFLWLACAPDVRDDTRLVRLLIEVERLAGAHSERELFFVRHLATLGSRAVPLMIARLLDETQNRDWSLEQAVGAGLLQVGVAESEPVQHAAEQLLARPEERARAVAVRVLARYPALEVVDRLWVLLCDAAGRLARRHEPGKDLADYRAASRALRACLMASPDWLGQKVLSSQTASTQLGELAFLLAGVHEHPAAHQLWLETKSRFLAEIPPEDRRGVARCVTVFRDAAEADRMEEWIAASDGWLKQTAFAALARVNPDRAIASLNRMETGDLYLTRGWFLPELLARRRPQALEAIQGLLRAAPDPLRVASVFQGRENDMDAATFELLLDGLEHRLDQLSVHSGSERETRLRAWLDLLSEATRLELLECLRRRAGSHLERVLADTACTWVGRSGRCRDHELDAARTLLLRIGGGGFTRLVNACLSHSEWLWRLEGYRFAAARPDDETLALVREASEKPAPEHGRDDTYDPFFACEALDDLGETEALSRAVRRLGLSTPRHLTDPPAGDQMTTRAGVEEALQDLKGAGRGNRAGAILAVAVCGSHGDLAHLVPLIDDVDNDSEEALALAHAFRRLAPDAEDALTFLHCQLDVPKHRWAARQALWEIRTEQALDTLTDHLLESYRASSTFDSEELGFSIDLHRSGVRRSDLVEALAKAADSPSVRSVHPFLLGELALAGDERALEWAWETARPEQGPITTGGVATIEAIHALAQNDLDAARTATSRVLASDAKGREKVPRLAVRELGRDWAVAALIEQAPREVGSACRRAIGAALREAHDEPALGAALERLLASGDPRDRATGCELAGWQPAGAFDASLQSLAVEDPSERVRVAARDALDRQQRERWAVELLEKAARQSGCGRWSLVEAACQLGEPELLSCGGYGRLLAEALEASPRALTKLVEEVLKRRLDDVRREAERADRDREDH